MCSGTTTGPERALCEWRGGPSSEYCGALGPSKRTLAGATFGSAPGPRTPIFPRPSLHRKSLWPANAPGETYNSRSGQFRGPARRLSGGPSRWSMCAVPYAASGQLHVVYSLMEFDDLGRKCTRLDANILACKLIINA